MSLPHPRRRPREHLPPSLHQPIPCNLLRHLTPTTNRSLCLHHATTKTPRASPSDPPQHHPARPSPARDSHLHWIHEPSPPTSFFIRSPAHVLHSDIFFLREQNPSFARERHFFPV
ncbi:predicted protein [Arabidopsis lyrata subsp. lyrata]|uniref:Predicted protein n=1 Tax=Arabidopsis lyrata subsp. lyrata TaxID=81972 RepID=D7MPN7_ARALL|nr:predicted protein [Arabidopsis lyrata subsp. lyrata]